MNYEALIKFFLHLLLFEKVKGQQGAIMFKLYQMYF